MKRLVSLILCMLMLSGFALSAYAEGGVADASQMTTVEEVVEPGMTPVYAADLVDGEYDVAFKCSSSMFRIESALLKVLYLRITELYKKWNGSKVQNWAMVRNQLVTDDKIKARIEKYEHMI